MNAKNWYPIRFDPTQKPDPGAAELNPDHDLAKGLVAAYTFNEGGGLRAYDAVSTVGGTLVGQSFVAGGIVATSAATTSILNTGRLSGFSSTTGTVAWRMTPGFSPTDAAQHFFWGMTTGVSSPEFSAQKFTDNKWYVGWNNAGGDRRVTFAASAANLTQSVAQSFAFTWGAFGSILYRNGVQIGANALVPTTTAVANPFGWGGATTSGGPSMGVGTIMEYGLVSTAVLDAAQLHAEPYAMYRPVVRRAYSVPASVTIYSRRTRSNRVGTRTAA